MVVYICSGIQAAFVIAMRLSSVRQRLRLKGWTLMIAWSVFWVLSALAPFCEGWAAIKGASGDATHLAMEVPAGAELNQTQGEEPCCHSLAEVSVVDAKSDSSGVSMTTIKPGIPVAQAAFSIVSAGTASHRRLKPAHRSGGPVFLNTLRLRV
jgi:hypothetical protein